MITLTGVSGKGTLWCTFTDPDHGFTPYGYAYLQGHLDGTVPPSDWYLPPPDKVWYSVVSSPYGPRLTGLRIGSISSVNTNPDGWNPCEHSTLRGQAIYRGPTDANAPYWTYRYSGLDTQTVFTACTGSLYRPSLSQSRQTCMYGRPAKDGYVNSSLVFNRKGIKTKTQFTTVNGGGQVSQGKIPFSPLWGPDWLLSTYTQYGTPYQQGQWYAHGYNGAIATDPHWLCRFIRAEWERKNRTTFIRRQWNEYHSTQSYTPESMTGYTGYGYLKEGTFRTATCAVTHVMSDYAGRFWVKYDSHVDLEYDYWDLSSGRVAREITSDKKGVIRPLMVLEPGLTSDYDVPTGYADQYCQQALERAKLLYDPDAAKSARTAAVRDVQELDSNWIENLSGLKGTLDVVKPLISGYKAVKNGDIGEAKKALAGGYLVYKYVIKPSIEDFKNVKNDGKRVYSLATKFRYSGERRRGKVVIDDLPVCDTKATCSYFTEYLLRLKDNYFSQIWNALEKLGIDPSAGQLWDLVPFSFVADWFLPIGDSLRNIDAYNSMVLHRELLCRIETSKVVWPVSTEVLDGLFGGAIRPVGKPIEYSWYDRRVYHSFGIIDPIASNSDDNGLTSSQMAQGAALLTQMKR